MFIAFAYREREIETGSHAGLSFEIWESSREWDLEIRGKA
jgi:hypothetical protein